MLGQNCSAAYQSSGKKSSVRHREEVLVVCGVNSDWIWLGS